MRRCSRLLPLLLAGCAAGLAACGSPKGPAAASGKDLTPAEYEVLSDRDKIAYRNVTLRVSDAWGGTLLPFDKGPYPSILEKAIHTGDTDALMAQYNRALFELQHPRIKVEFVNYDMWSMNARTVLAVALAAHRAPAVYIARDLPQTIDQGLYADITDLLAGWEQRDRQPEGSIREGTVGGRHYTVAGNEVGGTLIRYRKDWFREAGIFNEHGEPGPPDHWTWEDFRRIAKRLTDPARKRWGFAGDTNDFFYTDAYGVRFYVPDRSGQHTWRFNDEDPRLIESLKAARAMVRDDGSVSTSVSMGWFERHAEFDASRAAMISSFSPHIVRESVEQPVKFGADKPYRDTVGMALPPVGPTGLTGFKALTNNFGFDPTLSRKELEAAFEWTKSFFYGDIFSNTVRGNLQHDHALGRQSAAYAVVMTTPYQPEPGLLDQPMEAVFPKDYLRTYARIRKSPAPPLPREFGLREPAAGEFDSALKALYSEAILSDNVDLPALVRKTAAIVNGTIFNFKTPGDREGLRRYFTALGDFYRRHYPRFYQKDWPGLYERYYRID